MKELKEWTVIGLGGYKDFDNYEDARIWAEKESRGGYHLVGHPATIPIIRSDDVEWVCVKIKED